MLIAVRMGVREAECGARPVDAASNVSYDDRPEPEPCHRR